MAPTSCAPTWARVDAPRRSPARNAYSVPHACAEVAVDTPPVTSDVTTPAPGKAAWVIMPTAPTGATSVSPAARADTFVSTRARTTTTAMTAGPTPNADRPTTTKVKTQTMKSDVRERAPGDRAA